MTLALALLAAAQCVALAFALRRICQLHAHILRQARALREERSERARLAAQVSVLNQREGIRQRQALHVVVGHKEVEWRTS